MASNSFQRDAILVKSVLVRLRVGRLVKVFIFSNIVLYTAFFFCQKRYYYSEAEVLLSIAGGASFDLGKIAIPGIGASKTLSSEDIITIASSDSFLHELALRSKDKISWLSEPLADSAAFLKSKLESEYYGVSEKDNSIVFHVRSPDSLLSSSVVLDAYTMLNEIQLKRSSSSKLRTYNQLQLRIDSLEQEITSIFRRRAVLMDNSSNLLMSIDKVDMVEYEKEIVILTEMLKASYSSLPMFDPGLNTPEDLYLLSEYPLSAEKDGIFFLKQHVILFGISSLLSLVLVWRRDQFIFSYNLIRNANN